MQGQAPKRHPAPDAGRLNSKVKRGALAWARFGQAQRLLHTGLGPTRPRCGCTGAEMKIKTKQFSEAIKNFGEPLFSYGGARATLHEREPSAQKLATACVASAHFGRSISDGGRRGLCRPFSAGRSERVDRCTCFACVLGTATEWQQCASPQCSSWSAFGVAFTSALFITWAISCAASCVACACAQFDNTPNQSTRRTQSNRFTGQILTTGCIATRFLGISAQTFRI